MSLIELSGVTKVYRMGRVEVPALAGVDLRIEAGEMVAIVGPSGSGKSTVMNIVGLLDRPTAGSYWLDGKEVGRLRERELAFQRARKIGFVFQSFNLLARVSALENVELALAYARLGERRRRARQALELVGLGPRMRHRPNELSGGEQQRVALARALVKEPAIILADEPTGNLDSRTAHEILEVFERLNRQHGITIAVITHDPSVAGRANRVVTLHDGQIVSDTRQADMGPVVAAQIAGDQS